jgi:hypothetical protein
MVVVVVVVDYQATLLVYHMVDPHGDYADLQNHASYDALSFLQGNAGRNYNIPFRQC